MQYTPKFSQHFNTAPSQQLWHQRNLPITSLHTLHRPPTHTSPQRPMPTRNYIPMPSQTYSTKLHDRLTTPLKTHTRSMHKVTHRCNTFLTKKELLNTHHHRNPNIPIKTTKLEQTWKNNPTYANLPRILQNKHSKIFGQTIMYGITTITQIQNKDTMGRHTIPIRIPKHIQTNTQNHQGNTTTSQNFIPYPPPSVYVPHTNPFQPPQQTSGGSLPLMLCIHVRFGTYLLGGYLP